MYIYIYEYIYISRFLVPASVAMVEPMKVE